MSAFVPIGTFVANIKQSESFNNQIYKKTKHHEFKLIILDIHD